MALEAKRIRVAAVQSWAEPCEVKKNLARRNGVPVVLCSMGGDFETRGSPVLPIRRRCPYAGRSGIYLPSGPVAGPMGPGEVGTLTAEMPLGPAVAPPEPDVHLDCGVPLRVELFDRLMLGRARRVYRHNLARLVRSGARDDSRRKG